VIATERPSLVVLWSGGLPIDSPWKVVSARVTHQALR
jgi:hypothetical protein